MPRKPRPATDDTPSVDELSQRVRVLTPLATTVGVHSALLDALDGKLDDGFAGVNAKLDDLAEVSSAIATRVDSIESSLDYDRGARDGRAEALQDTRQTLALRIAANSWIRPALSGGVLLGAAELLRHLLNN